jgi:glycosyltransferase involved in cell wall biosynthesis
MDGDRKVALNVHVDTAIYSLQQQGGVSRLWRSLLPALQTAMPDTTFNPALPPDVFLSTYYRPAPLGVKSVALVYDLIVDRYPLITNKADSIDIHRAVNEASAVVSISAATARDVQRLCGKPSAVAYPGVDADFGKVAPSAVERFQAFTGRPYVLAVGRRGLYKNVQALYQAWGLWGLHAHYKLLCVGGEEGLPQDAAFERRYRDTWQHLGLSDDDLRAAYAGAVALVYPSLMEGFGLPLVEAMACGCPIVCDPAMREVTGDAAFYCDVTKPREIAAALAEATTPGMRLERITRGIERVKTFTWARMAEGVADAIRRAA